jgi:Gam-like protein
MLGAAREIRTFQARWRAGAAAIGEIFGCVPASLPPLMTHQARSNTVTPLKEIEAKTKTYADARDVLGARVQELNDAIEQAKRAAMPGIKRALARAAELQAELRAAIEEAPDAFTKPRSHIFHGIKVGYQKAVGKIEFDDADRVVELIEKHFPDQADVLVKTEKKPLKKALEALDVAELKKLGVRVADNGDVVIIKPTDTEVDKVVTALLKEATEEAEEAT